jgi:hypothetical protein
MRITHHRCFDARRPSRFRQGRQKIACFSSGRDFDPAGLRPIIDGTAKAEVFPWNRRLVEVRGGEGIDIDALERSQTPPRLRGKSDVREHSR